jgi:DHA1 family multidrug resistance protein-like MFS transporter
MTVKQVIQTTMLKPFTLTFTEPIVLAINLYIGLIYGISDPTHLCLPLIVAAILYSYFESFPLVYGPTGYGFSLGVSTLPFLSLLVGALISYGIYAVWNR